MSAPTSSYNSTAVQPGCNTHGNTTAVQRITRAARRQRGAADGDAGRRYSIQLGYYSMLLLSHISICSVRRRQHPQNMYIQWQHLHFQQSSWFSISLRDCMGLSLPYSPPMPRRIEAGPPRWRPRPDSRHSSLARRGDAHGGDGDVADGRWPSTHRQRFADRAVTRPPVWCLQPSPDAELGRS